MHKTKAYDESVYISSIEFIYLNIFPSNSLQYVVVDYLWYRKKVKGAYPDSLGFDVIDKWGRMIPDPGRWPSSKGGKAL